MVKCSPLPVYCTLYTAGLKHAIWTLCFFSWVGEHKRLINFMSLLDVFIQITFGFTIKFKSPIFTFEKMSSAFRVGVLFLLASSALSENGDCCISLISLLCVEVLVRCFLAVWGFNTVSDLQLYLHIIHLNEFSQGEVPCDSIIFSSLFNF